MANSCLTSTVCRYDVFLSFRGVDTRKSFTDHLYESLKSEYDTFRDKEEIETGESLWPEIVKAIKGSKISVIVFSKNYASSPWCLDEVVTILKCKKTSGHLVLPVFYDVRPSEIRKQKGMTGEAFNKFNLQCEAEIDIKKKMELAEKIRGWKEALEQVADLVGLELKNQADGHEAKFIKKIVKEVGNMLRYDRKLDVGPYEIGIESRTDRINLWLQDRYDGPGILGICGMGGIGKTTIANHVYNQNCKYFDCSCFLANIKEKCEQPDGLVLLQRQLLSDVLKRKQEEINNADEGIAKIKKALPKKRVLLIFDDVDHQSDELLEAIRLMQKKLLPGSKIIITTRDEKLLYPHEIYRLKELDGEESLKLFSLHAFRKESPPESLKEQAKLVIQLCGGLPLALRVIGSSLYRTNVDLWEDEVKKLQSVPPKKILQKLRISYDSLQDDDNERIFLHIACFFLGHDKDETVLLLKSCSLHATVGIENLRSRCLLTVDSENKLSMHQLIRDMGREIVRQESVDEPGERSRLCLPKDCCYVLKNKTGTKKIHGLTFNMRMLQDDNDTSSFKKWRYENPNENSIVSNYISLKEKQWKLLSYTSSSPNEAELDTDAFQEMRNLRILKLGHVHLSGSYKNFPKNLRWLCWRGFPLKLIPTELCLENLVVLDLSYNTFTQVWKWPKLLGSLKIFNLSYCKGLAITPNFSGSRYLEKLILKGCSSLVKICESIELLGELVILDLECCESLMKLPRNIHMLRSLETLIISGCSNLVQLPTNLRNMASLEVILSDNMNRIDRELYLTSIPGSIVKLSLVSCGLYEYSFPSSFGNLALLKELDIGSNFFVNLPDSIKCLPNLQSLAMCSSRLLLSVLGLPCTLKYLNLTYCYYVKKVSFQSDQTQIARVKTSVCEDLNEIEGFFKIESLGNVDSKIIRLMGINMELMGNTEVPFRDLFCTRMRPIQVLHEFGIISTFIPSNMVPSFDAIFKGSSMSFTTPSTPNQQNLFLNVLAVYKGWPNLIIEIHNWTKNLTWIYVPICYGFPYDGTDMAWLSLWNFGNQSANQELTVTIFSDLGCKIRECGYSVVYEENDEKDNDTAYYYGNEVIGGDLSNLQLNNKTYMLSRNNIEVVDERGLWDESRQREVIRRRVRCTVSLDRRLPSLLVSPFGSKYVLKEPPKWNISIVSDHISDLTGTGASYTAGLTAKEKQTLHRFVVNNCAELIPWMAAYEDVSASNFPDEITNYRIELFNPSLSKYLEDPDTISAAELRNLCVGSQWARKYTKCSVDGVKWISGISGVMEVVEGVEYFGILLEVIELLYGNRMPVVVFKCRWYDEKTAYTNGGLISINTKTSCYKDSPFILALLATQVFYTKDHNLGYPWKIVNRMFERGVHNDIGLESDENTSPLYSLNEVYHDAVPTFGLISNTLSDVASTSYVEISSDEHSEYCPSDEHSEYCPSDEDSEYYPSDESGEYCSSDEDGIYYSADGSEVHNITEDEGDVAGIINNNSYNLSDDERNYDSSSS